MSNWLDMFLQSAAKRMLDRLALLRKNNNVPHKHRVVVLHVYSTSLRYQLPCRSPS